MERTAKPTVDAAKGCVADAGEARSGGDRHDASSQHAQGLLADRPAPALTRATRAAAPTA
ncbi:hypothetical protein [Streptomyces sp. TE33382]